MSIKAGGNLMPMAEQVRRAIAWVYKNAASFGGDPNRIYVSGHSSGAHLAGTSLITDWEGFRRADRMSSRARCCASGMYDLKPVRLSKRASLRQVHRRDGGGAVVRSAISPASTAR